MEQPRIVTRDEWVAARKELLIKEKAATRAHDALSAERRRLPMVKVDKTYTFDTPRGRRTLAELFEGRSQLMIYHFMMGPDWAEGCPSCSFLADGIDGTIAHLAHRDVTLMAVSRAPLQNIEAFKTAHGLEVSVGLLVRQRLQSSTSACLSPKRNSRAEKRSTTTSPSAFRSTRRRGSACSSRPPLVTYSTRTRRMLAVGRR